MSPARGEEWPSCLRQVRNAILALAKAQRPRRQYTAESYDPVTRAVKLLASLLGSRWAAEAIEEALSLLAFREGEGVRVQLRPVDRAHLYPEAHVRRFVAHLHRLRPDLGQPGRVTWRDAREEDAIDAQGNLEPALRFPSTALALAFEPQSAPVDPDDENSGWEYTGLYALAHIDAELLGEWETFLQQGQVAEGDGG